VAEGSYILRLDRGEEVIETLKQFAKESKIKGCWFSGIGAVKSAELAYYNLKSKMYETKIIGKELEVVSLSGNIVWMNKNPIVHAHTVLSGREMETYGGHLMKAYVSATLEICLVSSGKKIMRTRDKITGLNLLEL